MNDILDQKRSFVFRTFAQRETALKRRAMKHFLWSVLIVAYCSADVNEHIVRCSYGRKVTKDGLLDKAMKKYLTSRRLGSVMIPDFNYTIQVGLFKWQMEFYNGTILGLNAVQRVGSNYFAAKWNENIQVRAALRFEGLNVSIAFRKKDLIGYTKATVTGIAPAIEFVAEIREVGGILQLRRLDLTGIDKLQIRFRFSTKIWRIVNNMNKLQKYINKKINEKLRTELFDAVQRILHQLGERHTGKRPRCRNCTTFEIALQNAMIKYNLDPTPLPTVTKDLFASLAQVKVTNGTVRGLSMLRPSGDIVTMMNDCGAYASFDVTVRNLSVTLYVNFTTMFVDIVAIVTVNISARTVVTIVERNDTLVMEQLVVNITEAVHVSVTPIGTVSSVVAFFLPPKFLAEMIKRNIHQLMNSTIQSGLDSLYTFAHGNASGA
uniref:Glycine rich superfamily member n=1 Tax=Rhipicephalus appendiculatus TaxID=34631 RepID=A0A131YKT8_RHIAP